ncbi:MAG: efflux RND transporter periplasmic adaptor subunit [Rhodospirillaceae bacterium]
MPIFPPFSPPISAPVRTRQAAALALALLIAACDDKPPAGPRPMPPAAVGVVTVTPRRVAVTTELPGRTSAFRVAEVRPQVGGIVLRRMFTEGAEVAAGQQLYQIDPATFQAAFESARADVAKAGANLKSVEAKAARYADLVKINAVSRQDYDDVVASREQNRAQISVARAALETARINVEYTKVYAPISGRIGRSNITEGALVTANQATPLATVTQLDPIYVDISQSSSELLRLRRAASAGQMRKEGEAQAPVTLRLDGTGEVYEYPGQLQFSEVTADPATGAVRLRAVFPNPRQALYPGLFVRAMVDQGSRDAALLVPQQALVRGSGGAASVWVVDADRKANPRPVETGPAIGNDWLITKGLQAGDQVVVEGLQKVRPGAEVAPFPAAVAAVPPAPGASPSVQP